jgi:uncharacterized protein
MNIVIDTNILVSAFVFGGTIRRQLTRILEREDIRIVISADITRELTAVLSRQEFARFQDRATLETLLDGFLADAEDVRVTVRINACRDPKDNKFLEAAVAGNATVIVTGDADLLALNPFEGIQILSISVFLSQYIE